MTKPTTRERVAKLAQAPKKKYKNKALHLQILFKPVEPEMKTKSGLIIRTEDRATRDKYAENIGELVGMGKQAFYDWDESERPKIGDMIKTTKYPGLECVEDDGTFLRLCEYTHVMGKIEE